MSNTRTIVDYTPLSMSAKPAEGAKSPAQFVVKTWNNSVSLTVFTNVEGLPRKGIIGANLNPMEFYTFLMSLKEIAESPLNGTKVADQMDIFDSTKSDANLKATLTWGRTDKGMMYLCLTSPDSDFPKIPFYFRLPRIIKYKTNRADEDIVVESRIACLGRISFWENLFASFFLHNFVDLTKDGNYNNKGNNNKSNNNNSGGYSPSVSDDDIF